MALFEGQAPIRLFIFQLNSYMNKGFDYFPTRVLVSGVVVQVRPYNSHTNETKCSTLVLQLDDGTGVVEFTSTLDEIKVPMGRLVDVLIRVDQLLCPHSSDNSSSTSSLANNSREGSNICLTAENLFILQDPTFECLKMLETIKVQRAIQEEEGEEEKKWKTKKILTDQGKGKSSEDMKVAEWWSKLSRQELAMQIDGPSPSKQGKCVFFLIILLFNYSFPLPFRGFYVYNKCGRGGN